MEDFVKHLLSTADLSVLTKKVVRKQYMVHTGKQSLTDEEKFLLNSTVVSLLEELAKQQENITDPEVPTQKKDKENVLPSDQANNLTEVQIQPLSPRKTSKQLKSTVQEGEGSKKLERAANVRVDVVNSQKKTIRIGLKTPRYSDSRDQTSTIDSSVVIEDSDSDINKNTQYLNPSQKKNKIDKKLGITKNVSKKNLNTQKASPRTVKKTSPRMMKLDEAVDSVMDSESHSENESEEETFKKVRTKGKYPRIESSSESEQVQVGKIKKNTISDDDDISDTHVDEDYNLSTEDISRKVNSPETFVKHQDHISLSVKKYDKVKHKTLQHAKMCIEINSDDSVKNTLKKKRVQKCPSNKDDSDGKIHIFSVSESDSERDKQMKKDLDIKTMGRKLNTIYEDLTKNTKDKNSRTKRKRNNSDSDNKNSKFSKRRKLNECLKSKKDDSDNEEDSNDEDSVCSESEEDMHKKSFHSSSDESSGDDVPDDPESDEDDMPLKPKKTKSKNNSGSKKGKQKLSSKKSSKVLQHVNSEDSPSNNEENLESESSSDSANDFDSASKQIKHIKAKNKVNKSNSSKVKTTKTVLSVSSNDSEEEIPLSKQRVSKFVDEKQIDSGQESGFVLNNRKCKSTLEHATPKRKKKCSPIPKHVTSSEEEYLPSSTRKRSKSKRQCHSKSGLSSEEEYLPSSLRKGKRNIPEDVSSSDDEEGSPLRKKASSLRKTKDVSDSDEEDRPLRKKASSLRKTKDVSDSDEEDRPLRKKASSLRKTKDVSDSDEEDRPLRKKGRSPRNTKHVSDSDEEDQPLRKKGRSPRNTKDVSDSDEEDQPLRKKGRSPRNTKDVSDSDEEYPYSLKRNSDVRQTSPEDVSSSESEEVASLERKDKRRQTSRVNTEITNDSDSDSQEEGNKSDANSESHSNKSDCSESEQDRVRIKKTSPVSKTRVTSDSDSDADLATVKKKSVQKKKLNSSKSKVSGNSDSDMALVTAKKKTDKKKQENTNKPKSDEKPYLKNLRKICHALGIIVRNTIELKGCETEEEKIKRMKELLSKAGMKGQPSMKKVKNLKLLKEAAQLDTSNILTSDKGRATRSRVPSRTSPTKTVCVSPSVKKTFSRLKGIVDSEGSESD